MPCANGDRDEEALALTLEILNAAENAARIEETEPTPGPTMRAAIIYRRRGDRDAEIAILQRWIDACPAPADPYAWKPGERLRKLLS